MLEAALEAGFAAAGVDVMLPGRCRRPAVAYLTRALRLSGRRGDQRLAQPYRRQRHQVLSAERHQAAGRGRGGDRGAPGRSRWAAPSAQLGKARRFDDAAGRYIEFCKSTFPNELDLRGMKIVVDCAHGAAYHIAPKVFHELGAEVIEVGAEPNGLNINAGRRDAPGALQPGGRRAGRRLGHRARRRRRPAHDGRRRRPHLRRRPAALRDRPHRLKRRAAGRRGRHADDQPRDGAGARPARHALRARQGRRPLRPRTLIERGWKLGGENSGHIICLDRHTTGDGIVSALQVLAALRLAALHPRSRLRRLTLYPQTLVNVRLPSGFDWQRRPEIESARLAARKRNWATPAGCCCAPPAPSRCCA
jgi:phosphoglucosamine mutase